MYLCDSGLVIHSHKQAIFLLLSFLIPDEVGKDSEG